jgi:hypothetical protein
MTNLLLTFIVLAVTVLTVVQLVFITKLNRIKADIIDFITPDEDGQPSKLGQMAAGLGDHIASKTVENAKTTLMGYKSGQARQEKAVEAAFAKDMIGMQSPLAGAALQAFPSLQKLIEKNPAMADLVMSKLGSQGSKTVSTAPSNGRNHRDPFNV